MKTITLPKEEETDMNAYDYIEFDITASEDARTSLEVEIQNVIEQHLFKPNTRQERALIADEISSNINALIREYQLPELFDTQVKVDVKHTDANGLGLLVNLTEDRPGRVQQGKQYLW